ncbi:MAG: tetratricopeptide repeat protein, partial [Chloroflexota bacterium]|nr:tetratricopeptide repeat protein [Chloroflexota bacterium]
QKSDSENASQSSQLAHTIQRAQLKDAPSYTLLAVGQELAAKNQWELAAHAFWRATQLRPDYAEAWAYLGEANQHLDETPAEAGLVELKKAIEQNPESLAANTFFAIYWQRKGDIEEAQEYLLTAASLDPSNPALQIYVGELWAQQGDLTAAQSHYQKALELDTHSAATLQALVEFSIRYNLDLRATALPAARQAVLLAPDDPASLDVMGQILFRLGDSLNAKRFWLRALEEDAVYAPTHLHLGLCYIFQDQPDLAREHLAMAISLAPDSAIAAHAQRLLEDFP